MIDWIPYGYNEAETLPIGLIPGRGTEVQREQYTVITEQGEVTVVLKGTFYHTVGTREGFPCVGDFLWLQYNGNGASRIAKPLPCRTEFSRATFSGHAEGYNQTHTFVDDKSGYLMDKRTCHKSLAMETSK